MEGQTQRPDLKLSGQDYRDYRDERIYLSIQIDFLFVKTHMHMHATTKQILRKNWPTPIRGLLFPAVKSACVMQDKTLCVCVCLCY